MSVWLFLTLFLGVFFEPALGLCVFVSGATFFLMTGGPTFSERAW